MRIGIIGAGHIGGTLARHLARLGHEVAIANSRGPETLRDLVAELDGSVHAATATEAAAFGDLVVVSIPFGRYRELPVDELRGKVVIDTCNYYPSRDGHFADLDDDATTSSEKLQRFTGADVVKAFNAIYWENLRDRARPPGRPGQAEQSGQPDRLAIPISGDDDGAKGVVANLVRDIGFDPVDAGTLARGGRKHQPGSEVYTAVLSADEAASALSAA